jgi:formylglycine-generating enzyme required for sulfatase activity
MSRIFLSHSSTNNAEAVALRDWLKHEGWDDVFLDIDAGTGIAAGERWERALTEAASRCEAVLFLISRAWLASRWCLKEFELAYRLNKRLFGLLLEDIPYADLPVNLTRNWQLARLHSGGDHVKLRVTVPFTGKQEDVTFSEDALRRLKTGLQRAGLDSRFFAWPPKDDPDRPPYRGLRPLEAEDAGIFFGRDAFIVGVLDHLRGLRDAAPPRLLVILGASGAGKSSFLRAGVLPRLKRDDRNFLVLPIVRPERAVISGETGLLRALESAHETAQTGVPRADLEAAVEDGSAKLGPLLQALIDKAAVLPRDLNVDARQPTLILPIDQAEELFHAEAQDEAIRFLRLLRDLLIQDTPSITAVFTIRSDNYERLQLANELQDIRQDVIGLPPVPKGAYAEVIKGPARRLDGTSHSLKIEESLVDALLADVEASDAADALPLLAFTLERLYAEYHTGRQLKLVHYSDLGGVKGSIEAAVERALRAADDKSTISKDRTTRLALLRRGLIPWLAGIDPDTGAPRRRVARLSEIPAASRPLIEQFVEQRLLVTDLAKDNGEQTIEPAHEALLRQWGLLRDWLSEDVELLTLMEGIKRASRDWVASGKNSAWLTHETSRLEAAQKLLDRADLASSLRPDDRDYIAACKSKENATRRLRRRVQTLIGGMLLGIIAGLVAWINQSYLMERINWFTTMRPYMLASVRPYVLTPEAARSLQPLRSFRECAKDCPEMIVVPAGSFIMGSPPDEPGRSSREGPQRKVSIPRPFAVSKFNVTFDDWDACVSVGGCPNAPDSPSGRGTKPVVNVTWDEAQQYVAWLSRMTGQTYRLLSEAEWEYAARAGTMTAYHWGNDVGQGNANCDGCGSKWDNQETSPVGFFKPNAFGLYDMHGNVWQWVHDCYADNYKEAPIDGSARTTGDCSRRVVRGGSSNTGPARIRAAFRDRDSIGFRLDYLGFRIARTLPQ